MIFAAFALVYGTVIVVAIKRRLLGKLAFREGVRRPGQTLLVVGGLMVGAASITAASIGIDSANDSAVANAYRGLGGIDLTVSANDEPFPASVADAIRSDPALQGRVDGVQPAIEVFGSVINTSKKKSDAGVRLVSFDPATQEAFGEFILADGTRTVGADLGPKQVFISRQLADDLEIEVGDELKMGVAPVVEPDPTPKEIGQQLRDLGKRLKQLQKDAEDAVSKAAKRAGEHAGKVAAVAATKAITAQLTAQGQALAAGYLGQISAFKGSIKDAIQAAKDAEDALGLPRGSIPPFISEPVPPPPPSFAAPPADAIKAQIVAAATAAGQRAAEQKAKEVGKRWAKRGKRLGNELKHLQDKLKDTIDELKPVHLKVAGIAKAEGPGAYRLSSAVFAPLPLVQDIGNTDKITLVRISGMGDDHAGLDPATAALPAIRAQVATLGAELTFKGDTALGVQQAKANEVKSARDSAQFTSVLLIAMSVLVLSVGIALVLNLVQMLADERRPRLAILRAMGLTRRGLVTLSALEGAFYSILAAAVGTFLGIFAGRILAERFGKAFAEFSGGSIDYRFTFSLRWQTLAVSFALGALVTLSTVYFSAWRTSRMSIPAAIRNLPEPMKERHRRRWLRVLFSVILLAMGAGMLGSPQPSGRLLGGVLIAAVLARLLKKRIPERLRSSVLGLSLTAWAFYMLWQTAGEDDPNIFFSVFVMAIIIGVIGLALTVTANLRSMERLTGGVAGLLSPRVRAGVTPPMAYLTRRTGRTSLSIIMFAVVMAIISMSSVFLYLFLPNYERDSMGFDIVLTNAKEHPTSIPSSLKEQITQRSDIETKVYTGSLDTSFQDFDQTFLPLYFLTPDQIANPPIRLGSKDTSFDTDADVFRTVATDPKWVISSWGQTGDEIIVTDENGRPVTYKIAAQPPVGMFFPGMIGTEEKFAGLDTKLHGWASLLAVRENSQSQQVADALERAKFNDGVTTDLIHDLMERGYRANRTFFSVIDVLMRMGLIVGILSLGILGLRAIVERRHLIGVLRAMGFFKRAVMGGLLVEAFVTTVLGIMVGCAVGITTGYIFYISFFEQSTFGIDKHNLWSAIGMVFIAVFLVTIGPAWRASRLPPAEAVRYTE